MADDTRSNPELVKGAYVISYSLPVQSHLGAAMDRGLPVFRWTGEYLDLLDGCVYPGKLEYHPQNSMKAEFVGSSKAELALNAFQSNTVRAGIRREKKYSVELRSIGYKEAPLESADARLLPSEKCQGATHVGNMVIVGAFELQESENAGAGVGLNAGPVGLSAELERSLASFGAAGNFSDCDRKKHTDPAELPLECSAPLHVSLVPLKEPTNLPYYFEDRVIGASHRNVAFTNDDLREVSSSLEENLRQRAKQRGIRVDMLQSPSPTGVNCGILATPTPDLYALQCRRSDIILLERTGPRELLTHLTPVISRDLLDAASPTARVGPPPPAARVVFLIDLSLSMVVNDDTAFMTDDIRRSKRYQHVAIYLRHFLDSGFDLEASVVTFSGPKCTRTIDVDGRSLWPITYETVDASLTELQHRLREAPECAFKHSTDIAEALRTAGTIFSENEPAAGGDIVVLVTDGAHSVPASASTGSPEDEAANLHDAGVKFMGVRVQLNNLSPLRNALAGPDGPEIRKRWADYIGPEGPGLVEADWEDWLEEYAVENDSGRRLLDNLAGVEIHEFALNTDDSAESPLLTVHEQLIPESGGHELLSKADCEYRFVGGDDGTPHAQASCNIQLARDRGIQLKLEKPKCMDQVKFAKVFVTGAPPIELQLEHDTGTVAIFKEAQVIGDANINSPVTLVAEGTRLEGVSRCEN